VKNYWYWTSHGEEDNLEAGGVSSSQSMNFDYNHNDHNHMENMFHATFHANEMNMNSSHDVNPEAFYTILESTQSPLYEGCNIIELETFMRLFSIKSGYNMSQHCFNKIASLMNDICPPESCIPENYH